MKIYTTDKNKLIKRTEAGFDPNQEQAKIYYKSIEKDSKEYTAATTDKTEIENLLSLASIEDKTDRILVSIQYIENNMFYVCLYYTPKGKPCKHKSISNFSAEGSDYQQAEKIVDYINSTAK